MRASFVLSSASLLLAACAAPAVSGPPSERAGAMLTAVSSLAGEWDGTFGGKPVTTRFELSSQGSAVREVLFAGAPEEMTNVYHLDGDSMLVTHYCAMGNQPRMRARELKGGRIEFTLDSVTNRRSPDEPVMGQLVLELVDKDHMVEHWRHTGEAPSEPGVEFHFARRMPGTR